MNYRLNTTILGYCKYQEFPTFILSNELYEKITKLVEWGPKYTGYGMASEFTQPIKGKRINNYHWYGLCGLHVMVGLSRRILPMIS